MEGKRHYGVLVYKYSQFIVKTLKPLIDREYRILKAREHTRVAGSSMGGIISAYLGVVYPHIFSKIGALSTTSWFAEAQFLKMIKNFTLRKDQKFFIQVGTRESEEDIGNT